MKVFRARWWVAAAALLALVPGARLWHHFHPPHLLHAGDRLVPIALSSLSGARYTLAPTGRPQIINIFATWCTPCRMEMPGFVAAAKRLKARGIDVVGIDQEESGARVARFAQEFGLKYPLYIDTDGITHAVLGARLIPTTIFVGGDGRIRWIHPGPVTEHDLIALAETEKEAG
jgi:thiol-disulfide isomerase/thioredoxin